MSVAVVPISRRLINRHRSHNNSNRQQHRCGYAICDDFRFVRVGNETKQFASECEVAEKSRFVECHDDLERLNKSVSVCCNRVFGLVTRFDACRLLLFFFCVCVCVCMDEFPIQNLLHANFLGLSSRHEEI
jgi:hypothetical protein